MSKYIYIFFLFVAFSSFGQNDSIKKAELEEYQRKLGILKYKKNKEPHGFFNSILSTKSNITQEYSGQLVGLTVSNEKWSFKIYNNNIVEISNGSKTYKLNIEETPSIINSSNLKTYQITTKETDYLTWSSISIYDMSKWSIDQKSQFSGTKTNKNFVINIIGKVNFSFIAEKI